MDLQRAIMTLTGSTQPRIEPSITLRAARQNPRLSICLNRPRKVIFSLEEEQKRKNRSNIRAKKLVLNFSTAKTWKFVITIGALLSRIEVLLGAFYRAFSFCFGGVGFLRQRLRALITGFIGETSELSTIEFRS